MEGMESNRRDEPDEVEMEEWPAAVSHSRRVRMERGRSPKKMAFLDAPEIFHARRARGLVWPGQVDSRDGRLDPVVSGGGGGP